MVSLPRVTAFAGARRLPARDLMWATQTCTAIGPAVMPSVAAVRRVVWEYAALAPSSRLLNRVDHATGRLTKVAPGELGAFINELVVEFDDSPEVIGEPTVDDGRLRALTTDLSLAGVDDLPFRMRLGKKYCLWEFPHALGDATVSGPLWSALLQCAFVGRPPHELVVSYDSLVLPRALGETFARRPGRVRDLVAGSSVLGRRGSDAPRPRPAPPTRDTATTPDCPSPAPEDPELARPGPGCERTANGAVDRFVGRSAVGVLDTLRAWRREHAPTASVNSILFAASVAALEQEGLPRAENGLRVLTDLRRYLPEGVKAGGNFLISYHLHPVDPTSPEEIAAALRRATEAGRPLAAYAYTLAQRAIPRRPSAGVGTAGPQPFIPSFSALGTAVDMRELAWLAPPERRFYGGALSGGQPHGMSFGYAEIGGVLHVHANFDPDRLLPGLVRRAVTRLCADPVAVLEARPSILFAAH